MSHTCSEGPKRKTQILENGVAKTRNARLKYKRMAWRKRAMRDVRTAQVEERFGRGEQILRCSSWSKAQTGAHQSARETQSDGRDGELIKLSKQLRTALASAVRWLAIGFIYAMLPKPEHKLHIDILDTRSSVNCMIPDEHVQAVTRSRRNVVEQDVTFTSLVSSLGKWHRKYSLCSAEQTLQATSSKTLRLQKQDMDPAVGVENTSELVPGKELGLLHWELGAQSTL